MTRFVVEIKLMDVWVPYKILTRSPDIKHALNRLNYLVKDIEGGMENARIRRLGTDVQISEAKIEITRTWGASHLET